mmetsp:Transcript_10278/g.24153  ORF Transcript_10278/g.24153 Transcript_10278/m.24153 type:complete len:279 (-) Transcript_10278:60-896(-)
MRIFLTLMGYASWYTEVTFLSSVMEKFLHPYPFNSTKKNDPLRTCASVGVLCLMLSATARSLRGGGGQRAPFEVGLLGCRTWGGMGTEREADAHPSQGCLWGGVGGGHIALHFIVCLEDRRQEGSQIHAVAVAPILVLADREHQAVRVVLYPLSAMFLAHVLEVVLLTHLLPVPQPQKPLLHVAFGHDGDGRQKEAAVPLGDTDSRVEGTVTPVILCSLFQGELCDKENKVGRCTETPSALAASSRALIHPFSSSDISLPTSISLEDMLALVSGSSCG